MKKLTKEEFGNWLRKTRTEAGFTLGKFCLAIGKSKTYISRIERGDFDPPAEETLKTIAKILNVNEDKILATVGKISSDLKNIILSNPVEIAFLLRNKYNNLLHNGCIMDKIEKYCGTEAKFVEAKDLRTKKDKDKIVEYHALIHDDAGNPTPLVVKMKNDKLISVEKV